MENRYYGTGDIIERATGYLVKVGEPVFDDKVTANEYGVAFIIVGGSYAIKEDTQYLVTLEVNGESKMYRELWMSGNTETANEVALSDYTFTMDEGSIGGLTEDDVVIARFEPVEVYTSDAFRAAVSKTAPKSGGGSGGGGVLVVGVTVSGELGNVYTLDKTWQEIYDADYAAVLKGDVMMKEYCQIIGVNQNPFTNKYQVNVDIHDIEDVTTFSADSASGYPSVTLE